MTTPPPRGASVLVVDDDEDIVELVRFVLADAGYAVVTAGDGRQALAAVTAEMPDLILLDMKMPIMDGKQFAAELRRRHDDAAPIIVVTAAADARKQALEVGAVGWLAKPFELPDLLRAVRTQLGERPSERPTICGPGWNAPSSR